MRHTGRSKIALRSQNYCVSALSNTHYHLQSPIRDQPRADESPVSSADKPAPDPRIYFRNRYLAAYRKTVFVARILPQPTRHIFHQTMTVSDHPA